MECFVSSGFAFRKHGLRAIGYSLRVDGCLEDLEALLSLSKRCFFFCVVLLMFSSAALGLGSSRPDDQVCSRRCAAVPWMFTRAFEAGIL